MDFGWWNPGLSLGGLVAGLMVGLTGMGGAALVTPMLVLLFGVSPTAAVSSDVVASAIMKPVGSIVHIRHRTVHWRLVMWLSIGSVPGVLAGTWLFAKYATGPGMDATIKTWIGIVLLVALVAMVARTFVGARATRIAGVQELLGPTSPVKIAPTVILGLVVGVVVGMTSVGSGSLVVTCLLLLYPLLRPSVLVGTDLTQAVPMLIAGAIAHAGLGTVDWIILASLLIGQIPGVWIGSRMSSRYDGHALKWLLMVLLLAISMRLLGAPSLLAGGVAIGGVTVVVVLIVVDWVKKRKAAALA